MKAILTTFLTRKFFFIMLAIYFLSNSLYHLVTGEKNEPLWSLILMCIGWLHAMTIIVKEELYDKQGNEQSGSNEG